ncbi:hypothetical protein Salat_1548500 [Sesamum alatum]|uniref:Uncharacterized protein n=1 Tax=Sesamum alatum TaxID=300844 RepID=A0AAE1YCN5_9LAMI|nr:hypothetical protein Salat_1548500 [Sesamum alatum]
MSTTYFLVFLLGLVVLSATATPAEPNGLDRPTQMPFMGRFYSRGLAARIRNQYHSSKSIEKPHERATSDADMHWEKLKPAAARRTMQKVEEDHAAGCLMGGKNKNAENGGWRMSENRPGFVLPGGKKTTVDKLEEASKDKPAGYQAKTTDIDEVLDNGRY